MIGGRSKNSSEKWRQILGILKILGIGIEFRTKHGTFGQKFYFVSGEHNSRIDEIYPRISW